MAPLLCLRPTDYPSQRRNTQLSGATAIPEGDFFVPYLFLMDSSYFEQIRFLGGKLGTAIAATYEAQTVSDLL